MLLGALVVVVGGVAARNLTRIEIAFHDVVTALPDSILDGMRIINGAGALIAVLVVLAASIAARRIRFIGGVLVAAGLSAAIGEWFQQVVDAPAAVAASNTIDGTFPEYPNLRLCVLAAVFFVAAPELTRPARRLQWALLVIVSISVIGVTDGYPTGVLGSLALGWAVAALVHLAFGSPDGVPDPDSGPGRRRRTRHRRGRADPEQCPGVGRAGARVLHLGRRRAGGRHRPRRHRRPVHGEARPLRLVQGLGPLALAQPHPPDRAPCLSAAARRAGGHRRPHGHVAAGTAAGGKDALLVLAEPPGRPLPSVDADELERRPSSPPPGAASRSSTTPACPTRAWPPTGCASSTTAGSPSPTSPPPTPPPTTTPSSPTRPPSSSCWPPPPTRPRPSPRPAPRSATTALTAVLPAAAAGGAPPRPCRRPSPT